MLKQRFPTSCYLASACLLASAAQAQEAVAPQNLPADGSTTAQPAQALTPRDPAGADAPTRDKDEIGDIVVTANRTEGTLQRTPISIQVYDGAQLFNRGIADVKNLANIDTSIGYNTSGGQSVLSIRGISTSNATDTGEPAVGYALDGIFNARSYAIGAIQYDLERIEILRGPQGTLFGRNTTGGVINIITAKPNATAAAEVAVDFGNYATRNITGWANVPITDTLFARASFSARRHDGYRRNTPFDQRADDEDAISGRAQLKWVPSDRFDAWVSMTLTNEGGIGSAGESRPFAYPAGTPRNAVTGEAPGGTEPLHTARPLSDGKNYTIYARAGQKVDTTDIKGSLRYRVTDGITLYYLGGYNKISFERANPNIFRLNPIVFTRREYPRTLNNEFRVSSDPSDQFFWQGGVYLFEEKSTNRTDLVRNPGSAIETPLYLFQNPLIRQRSQAVFGQASFALTEQLKLTGGARYTWDQKRRRGTFSTYPAFTGLAATRVSLQNGDSKSEKLTWLAGIDYQATPSNLLYAKVSTGFKGGGFSGASQYRPETVTAYEVGTKNRFLDNRLQLNLAGFYMTLKDQQVNQYTSVNGSPIQAVVTNAGKSEIYGVEANVIASAGELGRFEISANYLHARYETFLLGAGWSTAARPTTLNLAGNALPTAPDFSASVQYEKTVQDVLGGSLTGRAAVKYQTKAWFGPENFADQYQAPYANADGTITYEPDDWNWSLQFYMNNIFDKKRLTSSGETYPFSTYFFSFAPPQTYGARFTAKF